MGIVNDERTETKRNATMKTLLHNVTDPLVIIRRIRAHVPTPPAKKHDALSRACALVFKANAARRLL